MEQRSEDDNPRIVDEHVSRWISTFLMDADVNQERTEYLSNYRNVLSDLPNAKAEDWDLAAAVVVQIISSNIYGNTIDIAKFQETSLDDIERLMYETERFQQEVPCEIHNMRRIYEAQPRFGTFVYSRIAMAMLLADQDPQYLIRMYEDVLEKIRTLRRIDVSVWNRSLVRDPLQDLYEQVGRFEDALNLSISSTSGTVWIRSKAENGENTARRFIGWMTQILGSGAIADAKRFLDLIYMLVKNVEGIDREEREQLSTCPKDTRQYWAWFYGYALGRLLVERPSLRQSLLYELDAGEWSEGWHAGGVIFDIPSDSWDEYRQWALRFYHHADIEHRVGTYTNDYTKRTPSGERQPPHLSAQSDLYWAMRVGFADAHIESGQDRQIGNQEIARALDQVKDIASSSALRTVGIETKLGLVSQDINRHLPPRDEHLVERLQSELPRVWQFLPKRTTKHLIKSIRSAYVRDPDEQCISLGKAVESMFLVLVKPVIQGQQVSFRGVTRFHIGPRSRISIYRWSQILEKCGPDEVNSSVGLKLLKAFPELDLAAFGRLSTELEAISELRGYAAHDSEASQDEKSSKAEELWKTVVGSTGYNGFLERFCTALGLMAQESVQRGKGGNPV